MHRIRVLLLLGCSVLGSSTPQEDAVTNAVDTCKHKLNTNFDFKFLDVPTKNPQNNGMFFAYSSYFTRPSSPLRRLFPWLYRPPKYQFLLTTAWKKPQTETRSPEQEQERRNDMVIRRCSGFLTNQQPIKYIFTCNNVTQEGSGREKTVEVSPILTTKAAEAGEGSGYDQDEEPPEDESWDLSRCLGCIFGMLNKP